MSIIVNNQKISDQVVVTTINTNDKLILRVAFVQASQAPIISTQGRLSRRDLVSYRETMRKLRWAAVILTALLLLPTVSAAETKEEWVALGARIHGAFGPFIPVGIRIGQDAVDKLQAGPRDLIVTYFNGEKPPCPCIADGVMIATHTSPGQGTFEMASNPAPEGMLALIMVRDKRSGAALRYTITDDWLPKILSWLKLDPPARFDAVIAAEGLYDVQAAR